METNADSAGKGRSFGYPGHAPPMLDRAKAMQMARMRIVGPLNSIAIFDFTRSQHRNLLSIARSKSAA